MDGLREMIRKVLSLNNNSRIIHEKYEEADAYEQYYASSHVLWSDGYVS